MILGIGTDVTALDRIRDLLEKHGDRFLRRIFTSLEREYCDTFSDPVPHLGARFAAKEAAYKAFGGAGPLHWKEMEIQNDPSGKPNLVFHGETARLAEEAGVRRSFVSLAHDAGMATAQVILEGEPPEEPVGG
jgi:holo-[acyl-carrier protein] synthase